MIDAFLDGLERRVAARRRHLAHRVGRVVLREPGRHRDRPPAPRRARAARARPRSPTPSSRTSTFRADVRRARVGTRSPRKGARVQRPLWASTSTKNPAYSPTLYVDTLIGRDTVNTLAQASVDVLARGDGDLRADTVLEDVDGARAGDRRSRRRGRRLRRRDRDARARRRRRRSPESFQDAVDTLEKKAARAQVALHGRGDDACAGARRSRPAWRAR